MIKVLAVILFTGMMASSIYAGSEVKLSGSAAVQVTKKPTDYTNGNVDDSWVRGEVKVAGKLENGVSGVIHLRTEPKLSGGMKGIDLQPRQLFFCLPISTITLTAGRWYEVYANGNNYFGRFLYDVNAVGTGSMNTNYSVLDGFKAALKFDQIKSALQLGVLPQDAKFDHTRLMASFGGNPAEGLNFTLAGNFDMLVPDSDDDRMHRAALNGSYTIFKDLKLMLFGEAAITDFNEVSDNAWFMVGLSSAFPNVLDRIQAEFEIKNHRNDATDAESNLCWMVMLQKTIMDITFDLNVGADQKSLGSKKAGDVGVIFRTTAKF